MSQIENPQIFIIGAGLSGITAAHNLISKGLHDVTILEAENRIGGRIETVKFNEGYIDFGAQWCAEQKNNSIFEMCHEDFEFGQSPFLEPKGFICLRSDGENIDPKIFEKLNLLKKRIACQYDEMKASTLTLGEFFELKYFEELKASEFNDVDDDMRIMFLDFWHTEIKTNYGTPTWFDVSAKLYAQKETCEESKYLTWKTSGFKTVLDILEKKYASNENLKDKILLNKKVTNINWEAKKIVIETEDKSVYQADHVIVTIPLGVLQAHHKSLFTPILPEGKVRAIESLGVAAMGKIFLEFEKPFWNEVNEEFTAASFFWTQEDLDKVLGTDGEWLTNLYGFLHLDGFPNVIESLVGGDTMREFETYSDEKIENDCLWVLEKFFKMKISRPIAMRRTKWLTRENFLGAYTYCSMNTAAYNVTPDDLKETISDECGKPKLLFAGEATSTRYMGSVHGAFDTGKEAAENLIEYYKNK